MGEDEEQQRPKSQEQDALFLCPSFSSYSSNRFAEIATKVNEELSRDTEFRAEEVSNKIEDDDDFEFALVSSYTDGNGDRPKFPIFDRALLNRDSKSETRPVRRNQLKNLFSEERESPSCSSSESDELEGVPSGTYCVWRPKSEKESPIIRKKSNSSGSTSKRWKFIDLVRRSSSDGGKDAIAFLTAKNRLDRGDKIEKSKEREQNRGESVKANGVTGGEKSLGRGVLYVKNRALNEDDGDRSISFHTGENLLGQLAV